MVDVAMVVEPGNTGEAISMPRAAADDALGMLPQVHSIPSVETTPPRMAMGC
jgi:hypothetical protein